MRARSVIVAGLAVTAGIVWWRRRAATPLAEIGLVGGAMRRVPADDPSAAELLGAAAAVRRALEGGA